MSGEAQIGGSCIFFTPERISTLEYVSQTTSTFAEFIFRRPPLSYTSNIYYLPLSATVWICSILLILLSAVVIYITYRHSVYQNSKQYSDSMRVSDVFLIIIATVCQMGSQLHPKRFSGRISSVIFVQTETVCQNNLLNFIVFKQIFFCIAMLFIYTSYTANIVALLQSTSNAINTLEDLLHSSLGFGVDDTPYHRFWFPAKTDPIRKGIYQTKIAPPNQPDRFMNLTTGINRVREVSNLSDWFERIFTENILPLQYQMPLGTICISCGNQQRIQTN